MTKIGKRFGKLARARQRAAAQAEEARLVQHVRGLVDQGREIRRTQHMAAGLRMMEAALLIMLGAAGGILAWAVAGR